MPMDGGRMASEQSDSGVGQKLDRVRETAGFRALWVLVAIELVVKAIESVLLVVMYLGNRNAFEFSFYRFVEMNADIYSTIIFFRIFRDLGNTEGVVFTLVEYTVAIVIVVFLLRRYSDAGK